MPKRCPKGKVRVHGKCYKVLQGQVAERTAKKLLEKDYPYPFPHVTGFFKEGKTWTAFDNTTGDMFVEQFKQKKFAKLFAENVDLTHEEVHELDNSMDMM